MRYAENTAGLVNTLNQHLLRNLDQSLSAKKVPISADQYNLMSQLWEADGICQQDIANQISRNRATTARMLDTLEKKGLLKRKDDKSN